jgi:hypothetical protein
MDDTLSIKALAISTVGATQLPGSALAFPRVVSGSQSVHLRRNSAISSLSPTDLRIQHTPRSEKSSVQRSLCSVDQTLARLDASSNQIDEDAFSVKLQADIPPGVTIEEFRAAAAILFGGLLANDGMLLNSIYYGEY